MGKDDPDKARETPPAHGSAAAPALIAAPLDAAAVGALLRTAGEISLVLDPDGLILDAAFADDALAAEDVAGWRGQRLVDLVTIESRPKIEQLLRDAVPGAPTRWRQVNHALLSGELPVRYACIRTGDRLIAVGRDMRAAAVMQQRLLQAQQSLERDYLRLRQTETRYRLMFDISDEAMLILDAATRRIVEANPAAHRVLGANPGSLPRQPAGVIVAARDRETLTAHLGAAAAGAAGVLAITLADGGAAELAATPFRQDRATFLLVRIAVSATPGAEAAEDAALAAVVERMPDAFVLADRKLTIVAANAAFAELAQTVSTAAMVGEPLGAWLGRPGVDLELIGAELRKNGAARSVATIMRTAAGGQEEVELSGVLVEDDGAEHYGFVIRSVARRLRDLPPVERDLPRSVEQLTELVGRMSLKEIVRESTDLIERLCIEAALTYTSDNRASAAEILGLSRQSLYSKLHRHGLGNLVDDRS